MPTAIQQKIEELGTKQKSWAELWESKPDRTFTPDETKTLQDGVEELNRLGEEIDTLRSLEEAETKNRQRLEAYHKVNRSVPFSSGPDDTPDKEPAEIKSLGDLFVESRAYQEFDRGARRGPTADVEDVEIKTLMTTSAGFTPQSLRSGKVVDSAQQMPKIVDLIPAVSTNQVAIKYMKETTFTNNAAEVAEGGLIPEAALVWTEQTSPVEKISVNIPVTEEQMVDVTGMRDRINNRLALMLRQRLDTEVVSGDGIAPNLLGIMNQSGILTQSATGDLVLNAILKALVKVNMTTGFAEADGIALHPLDWQDIALTQTDDGDYLFGGPAAPFPLRLWGLPVSTSTFLTQNTGIVGDFRQHSELAYYQGISFDVTNSNEDDFKHDILRVRARIRVAFTVDLSLAFCKVTNV